MRAKYFENKENNQHLSNKSEVYYFETSLFEIN